MKHLIYVLCWFLGVGEVLAQPEIEWQKSFGGSDSEEAHSTQQTSDGGYIVVGRTLSTNGDAAGNHGGSDFLIIKMNALGILQWRRSYGGSNNDRGYSIHQTTDGGYIVAGSTESNNGDVSGLKGELDAWVIKISNIGVIQWQKTLGGSGYDEAWSVRQTADGGYIVAGKSNSQDGDVSGNHGTFDFWLIKLDANGSLAWQKMLGGGMADEAYSVRQTNDNGYIIGGVTNSSDGDVTNYKANGDYWIVKVDESGNLQWQKALGTTSIDRVSSVNLTSDGGYIVLGNVSGNNGDVNGHHGGYDFWVVKLTDLGEVEWKKALGGSLEEFSAQIQQTSDGEFILFGTAQSTNGDVLGNDGGQEFWLVKLGAEGIIKWQKTIGGSVAEFGNSAFQTSDGGFILAGRSKSIDGDVTENNGSNDFWVVKLSPESTPTSNPSTQPLTLSPNPAQNTLTIQTQEPGKTDIQIYNLLGQVLQHQSPEMSDLGAAQVDVSQLPNGLYLISATGASGRVYSGRFLKGE